MKMHTLLILEIGELFYWWKGHLQKELIQVQEKL